MVAFIQDTRALFSGTRSPLFRRQYPVAPTSTATSYLMPHPLHLLLMGLMFVLLFQDPKDSRSICVLLSSLQLPLYNNIHLSHWSWKRPFRPIFPFSLSYWLIVRQWFCSSCPTIYLYMRFFACGDRIGGDRIGWVWRSSAVLASHYWVRPPYFLDWLGLTSLRWLIIVLGCSLLTIFQAFFLFYTSFPLSCNCANSSPTILNNTQHTTLAGFLFSLLSHLPPLPHTIYCLVQ